MKKMCWLFCMVAFGVGTVDVIAQTVCYQHCKNSNHIVRKELGGNGESHFFCDEHVTPNFGWVMNTTSATSDGISVSLPGIHSVKVHEGSKCARACDTITEAFPIVPHTGLVHTTNFPDNVCYQPSGS